MPPKPMAVGGTECAVKRITFYVSWTRWVVFRVGLLALLVAGTASAVELRDAELVASGSTALQNASGTVQLVDSRMSSLGPPVFVPEPGALWQLGAGLGFLALLAARRRHRTAPATPRRGIP